MNIVMITGHEYPVGTALTNRIRSYLEALAGEGHKVSVIVYKPTEHRNNPVNEKRGDLNGVHYISSAYSIYRAGSPLGARFSWIYSYLNCLVILLKQKRQCKIDVIMQGSAKSSLIPLVFILSRLIGAKYVLESCEYPWFILKKKAFNWVEKPLYLGIYFRLFDGVMAITNALVRYHKKYGKRNLKPMLLPMTVDMQRFEQRPPLENRITYIGNLSFYKDGVDILVEAFALIAAKYPEWILQIVGDTGKDQVLHSRAKELGLSGSIHLLGSVHRDLVPEILCKSKILALARPDNLQSEGGFPTKLGEYLATGNLCIVTDVGEIRDYLNDGVSALISAPGDIKAFAEKLEHGIQRYDELGCVREAGYTVCKNMFNSRVQGKRLAEYLSCLVYGTKRMQDEQS